MFRATVVGAKEAACELSQITWPVRASKAWTLGSWNFVSRGLLGSKTVGLPTSPMAVEP